MGGVLQQSICGIWKPLGFFSKKFTETQQRYSAYDCELLAVYTILKYFQYFLEGRQFPIYTDHEPFTFAFPQRPEKSSPRQLRHLNYIGQNTVDIRPHINAFSTGLCSISTRTTIRRRTFTIFKINIIKVYSIIIPASTLGRRSRSLLSKCWAHVRHLLRRQKKFWGAPRSRQRSLTLKLNVIIRRHNRPYGRSTQTPPILLLPHTLVQIKQNIYYR